MLDESLASEIVEYHHMPVKNNIVNRMVLNTLSWIPIDFIELVTEIQCIWSRSSWRLPLRFSLMIQDHGERGD